MGKLPSATSLGAGVGGVAVQDSAFPLPSYSPPQLQPRWDKLFHILRFRAQATSFPAFLTPGLGQRSSLDASAETSWWGNVRAAYKIPYCLRTLVFFFPLWALSPCSLSNPGCHKTARAFCWGLRQHWAMIYPPTSMSVLIHFTLHLSRRLQHRSLRLLWLWMTAPTTVVWEA